MTAVAYTESDATEYRTSIRRRLQGCATYVVLRRLEFPLDGRSASLPRLLRLCTDRFDVARLEDVVR